MKLLTLNKNCIQKRYAVFKEDMYSSVPYCKGGAREG